MGTLAERPDGAYEFIPYRSGPFCIALRLSDGPHIVVSFKAMEAVVWRLMKERQAHDQLAAYVPVRPNGTAWTRTFASEAAAWRILIGARTAPRPHCGSSTWRTRSARRRVGALRGLPVRRSVGRLLDRLLRLLR